MSDLVRIAQERTAGQALDPFVAEIWGKVLHFIECGDIAFRWEGYNCPDGPLIPKRVKSQIHGWCKLVGLKPYFEVALQVKEWSQTTSGELYFDWKYVWVLKLAKQALPSAALEEKIISEHGRPPGY